MRLDTLRLSIRPLTADAVEPLVALSTDAEVTRYMGGPRHPAALADSIHTAAAAPPRPFDLWPVYEKSSDRLVGHCGLVEKEVDGRGEIELVYVIARNAWGLGYATEAATALRDDALRTRGLTHLVALIDPDNAASARVASKLGMRRERLTTRPGGRLMKMWPLGSGQGRRAPATSRSDTAPGESRRARPSRGT